MCARVQGKVSRAPLDKLPGEISHENEDNCSERAFIRGRRLIFAAPFCVCGAAAARSLQITLIARWPMSREINANRCRWNVLFRPPKQPPIDETDACANISQLVRIPAQTGSGWGQIMTGKWSSHGCSQMVCKLRANFWFYIYDLTPSGWGYYIRESHFG